MVLKFHQDPANALGIATSITQEKDESLTRYAWGRGWAL
jgi:hypothetical protein